MVRIEKIEVIEKVCGIFWEDGLDFDHGPEFDQPIGRYSEEIHGAFGIAGQANEESRARRIRCLSERLDGTVRLRAYLGKLGCRTKSGNVQPFAGIPCITRPNFAIPSKPFVDARQPNPVRWFLSPGRVLTPFSRYSLLVGHGSYR
jgi:hypothetical protein